MDVKGAQALRDRIGTQFAVLDAKGECYAIRSDLEKAKRAADLAAAYLDEALACGHHGAVAWVKERLPIEVAEVTLEQVEQLLEEGTPILDREP